MTTTRLPANERNNFRKTGTGRGLERAEPALGALQERLDIIIRRHGGRLAPLPLRPAEREAYQAWLAGKGDALPDSLGGSYNRPIGQESQVA